MLIYKSSVLKIVKRQHIWVYPKFVYIQEYILLQFEPLQKNHESLNVPADNLSHCLIQNAGQKYR